MATYKVIFKKERDGTPIAFFPGVPGTRDPFTMSCYTQREQHATASIEYLRECTPASDKESSNLARELLFLGYALEIRRRHTRADLAARRAALENRNHG